jgi:hypothetical protein
MNWVEFWREYRLGSQLAMLKARHPSDRLIQQKGAELMGRLHELFSMLIIEDIKPALLHGMSLKGPDCVFDTVYNIAVGYGGDIVTDTWCSPKETSITVYEQGICGQGMFLRMKTASP